ncbi:hypothetical protein [Streptomyces sp. NPDC007856]|uniref:scabin-related ADP-ribosyltransferase n=1 Tax=Streptomyces sp. NPDC007856 TaxID=3364781 RepID=UPI00368A0A32
MHTANLLKGDWFGTPPRLDIDPSQFNSTALNTGTDDNGPFTGSGPYQLRPDDAEKWTDSTETLVNPDKGPRTWRGSSGIPANPESAPRADETLPAVGERGHTSAPRLPLRTTSPDRPDEGPVAAPHAAERITHPARGLDEAPSATSPATTAGPPPADGTLPTTGTGISGSPGRTAGAGTGPVGAGPLPQHAPAGPARVSVHEAWNDFAGRDSKSAEELLRLTRSLILKRVPEFGESDDAVKRAYAVLTSTELGRHLGAQAEALAKQVTAGRKYFMQGRVDWNLIHPGDQAAAVLSGGRETVWRFSEEDPHEVFEQGFSARDVSRVIEGRQWPGNRDAQFVATTRDPDLRFHNRRFRYQIDTASNSDPTGIDINATLGDESTFAEEQEIAFTGRIDPQAVVSVYDYFLDQTGTHRDGVVVWEHGDTSPEALAARQNRQTPHTLPPTPKETTAPTEETGSLSQDPAAVHHTTNTGLLSDNIDNTHSPAGTPGPPYAPAAPEPKIPAIETFGTAEPALPEPQAHEPAVDHGTRADWQAAFDEARDLLQSIDDEHELAQVLASAGHIVARDHVVPAPGGEETPYRRLHEDIVRSVASEILQYGEHLAEDHSRKLSTLFRTAPTGPRPARLLGGISPTGHDDRMQRNLQTPGAGSSQHGTRQASRRRDTTSPTAAADNTQPTTTSGGRLPDGLPERSARVTSAELPTTSHGHNTTETTTADNTQAGPSRQPAGRTRPAQKPADGGFTREGSLFSDADGAKKSLNESPAGVESSADSDDATLVAGDETGARLIPGEPKKPSTNPFRSVEDIRSWLSDVGKARILDANSRFPTDKHAYPAHPSRNVEYSAAYRNLHATPTRLSYSGSSSRHRPANEIRRSPLHDSQIAEHWHWYTGQGPRSEALQQIDRALQNWVGSLGVRNQAPLEYERRSLEEIMGAIHAWKLAKPHGSSRMEAVDRLLEHVAAQKQNIDRECELAHLARRADHQVPRLRQGPGTRGVRVEPGPTYLADHQVPRAQGDPDVPGVPPIRQVPGTHGTRGFWVLDWAGLLNIEGSVQFDHIYEALPDHPTIAARDQYARAPWNSTAIVLAVNLDHEGQVVRRDRGYELAVPHQRFTEQLVAVLSPFTGQGRGGIPIALAHFAGQAHSLARAIFEAIGRPVYFHTRPLVLRRGRTYWHLAPSSTDRERNPVGQWTLYDSEPPTYPAPPVHQTEGDVRPGEHGDTTTRGAADVAPSAGRLIRNSPFIGVVNTDEHMVDGLRAELRRVIASVGGNELTARAGADDRQARQAVKDAVLTDARVQSLARHLDAHSRANQTSSGEQHTEVEELFNAWWVSHADTSTPSPRIRPLGPDRSHGSAPKPVAAMRVSSTPGGGSERVPFDHGLTTVQAAGPGREQGEGATAAGRLDTSAALTSPVTAGPDSVPPGGRVFDELTGTRTATATEADGTGPAPSHGEADTSTGPGTPLPGVGPDDSQEAAAGNAAAPAARVAEADPTAVVSSLEEWNAFEADDPRSAGDLLTETLSLLRRHAPDYEDAETVKRAYSARTSTDRRQPLRHQAELLSNKVVDGHTYLLRGGAPTSPSGAVDRRTWPQNVTDPVEHVQSAGPGVVHVHPVSAQHPLSSTDRSAISDIAETILNISTWIARSRYPKPKITIVGFERRGLFGGGKEAASHAKTRAENVYSVLQESLLKGWGKRPWLRAFLDNSFDISLDLRPAAGRDVEIEVVYMPERSDSRAPRAAITPAPRTSRGSGENSARERRNSGKLRKQAERSETDRGRGAAPLAGGGDLSAGEWVFIEQEIPRSEIAYAPGLAAAAPGDHTGRNTDPVPDRAAGTAAGSDAGPRGDEGSAPDARNSGPRQAALGALRESLLPRRSRVLSRPELESVVAEAVAAFHLSGKAGAPDPGAVSEPVSLSPHEMSVQKCLLLLSSLRDRLFRQGIGPAAAQDDSVVGVRPQEELLTVGADWRAVTSWGALAHALESAGSGSAAFVLARRPSGIGHAFAAYALPGKNDGDTPQIVWVAADDSARISEDVPDIASSEAHAVVIDSSARVVPDALPASAASSSTNRPLIDAATRRQYGAGTSGTPEKMPWKWPADPVAYVRKAGNDVVHVYPLDASDPSGDSAQRKISQIARSILAVSMWTTKSGLPKPTIKIVTPVSKGLLQTDKDAYSAAMSRATEIGSELQKSLSAAWKSDYMLLAFLDGKFDVALDPQTKAKGNEVEVVYLPRKQQPSNSTIIPSGSRPADNPKPKSEPAANPRDPKPARKNEPTPVANSSGSKSTGKPEPVTPASTVGNKPARKFTKEPKKVVPLPPPAEDSEAWVLIDKPVPSDSFRPAGAPDREPDHPLAGPSRPRRRSGISGDPAASRPVTNSADTTPGPGRTWWSEAGVQTAGAGTTGRREAVNPLPVWEPPAGRVTVGYDGRPQTIPFPPSTHIFVERDGRRYGLTPTLLRDFLATSGIRLYEGSVADAVIPHLYTTDSMKVYRSYEGGRLLEDLRERSFREHALGQGGILEASVELSSRITEEFPPEQYFYLGLGRSPVPVVAALQASGHDADSIPLSSFRAGPADRRSILSETFDRRGFAPLTPQQQDLLYAHFDEFVLPHTRHDKSILLIDYSQSALSLFSAQHHLDEYFRARGIDIIPEALALHVDSPERPERSVQGLINEITKSVDSYIPGLPPRGPVDRAFERAVWRDTVHTLSLNSLGVMGRNMEHAFAKEAFDGISEYGRYKILDETPKTFKKTRPLRSHATGKNGYKALQNLLMFHPDPALTNLQLNERHAAIRRANNALAASREYRRRAQNWKQQLDTAIAERNSTLDWLAELEDRLISTSSARQKTSLKQDISSTRKELADANQKMSQTEEQLQAAEFLAKKAEKQERQARKEAGA